MNLTSVQRSTLKAFIQGDATLGSKVAAGDYDFVANALNANASPDFWCWRSFVADSEIYSATTGDGTVWSWTIYIARSQGERDGWRQMVNMAGGVNASLANVRQGIADIFSGAGGAAQRTHLLTIGRRKATIAEKVLAMGTGSTAVPATFGAEGSIGAGDIGGIMS